MIKTASEGEWQRFAAQLSESREAGEPVLPSHAHYLGILPAVSDYVLADDLLECVRNWLYARGESRAFYFLTESAGSQAGNANFVVDLWDLNEESLSEVNSGFESVLTGSDFEWALFVDHEGNVHVAGSTELFALLLACVQIDRSEAE